MASFNLDMNSVETDNLVIKDPFIYLAIPKNKLQLFSGKPPPPPKKGSSPSKSLVPPPPPPPKKGKSPSKSFVPPPPPPRGSSSISVRSPSKKGGKKQKYTRKLKKSNKRKSRRGRR